MSIYETQAPGGPGLMAAPPEQQTRIDISRLPRVNLLPPEIAEARRLRAATAGLGVAVLLGALVVGGLYVEASTSAKDAASEKATAEALVVTNQTKVDSLKNVSDLYAKADLAQNTLAGALGSEIQFSTKLQNLGIIIPENVFLSSISVTEDTGTASTSAVTIPGFEGGIGTVAIEGYAKNYPDAANFLDKLATDPCYTNVYYSTATASKPDGPPFVTFVSSANLSTKCLSGRYKPVGG